MFKAFYPKKDFNSVKDINFDGLRKKGYKAVLFDVDNTLVPHGAPADKAMIEFFARLHNDGFKTCLISNNKELRVQPFAKAVGTQYIYKAGKPLASGYEKAMELLGTNRNNTLFVGDQLFTDILGANRAGIYSILVKPIHPKEEIQIVLKRYLEKIVLFFYRRQVRKSTQQSSKNKI